MIALSRPVITLAVVATVAACLPGTPAGATSAPEPLVPDDWVVLEDDTGLLTVSVPPEWSDVETAPWTPDDGPEQARIAAATDLGVFSGGFDAPGLVLVAVPYDPDTVGVIDDALSAGCNTRGDSRYDDGAFVGTIRHWTSCSDEAGTAEVWVLAVTPVNRAITVVMLVQITDPSQRPDVDGVLATFNLTHLPDPPTTTTSTTTTTTAPDATTTTTTAPTGPTTPTVTTAATETTAPTTSLPVPTTPRTTAELAATTTGPPTTSPAVSVSDGEPQQVRDDTSALQIDVPAAWSDVDLSPVIRSTDGTELANIIASSDLDSFLPSQADDEFLTPGVLYRALPYTADPQSTLRDFGRLGCVDGGITPYSDDLFAGYIRTFPSCAGTSTRQFVIVASPADSSFTALLVIRLTEPGNTELSTVLGSFTYDPSAIAASPIATSS